MKRNGGRRAEFKILEWKMNKQVVRRLVLPMSWTWVVLTGLLAAVSVSCSVVSAESQIIEDSFIVSGSPKLVAEIDNGSIEVVSNSSGDSSIQVTATVRNPDRVDYRAVQEGDTVRVTGKVDEKFSFFSGASSGVNLVVSVPQEIDLELKSSNGDIEIAGTSGPISARTSNGLISITDLTGDIQAETSNGRVELVNVNGQVDAQTSNGSIDYSGTLRSGSENRLQTSNGSIMVSLAGTLGVEIDAATSNGQVSSLLPITIEGTAKDNELKGTIGGGGSALNIRTSNGSISIK
jgi:hypothetical protein